MTMVDPGPRATATIRRIERVLLATDLTVASEAATDRAIEIAAQLGASLVIVSVIDPGQLRLPGGGFRLRMDEERALRESAARACAVRAQKLGVATSTLIWQGDPADSIIEAAAAEDADLVVVGSRGRAKVGRLLLGSVSDEVVRTAGRPVLVVLTDAG
jgi:nucleotide-binding universal stress UspA family protein